MTLFLFDKMHEKNKLNVYEHILAITVCVLVSELVRSCVCNVVVYIHPYLFFSVDYQIVESKTDGY